MRAATATISVRRFLFEFQPRGAVFSCSDGLGSMHAEASITFSMQLASSDAELRTTRAVCQTGNARVTGAIHLCMHLCTPCCGRFGVATASPQPPIVTHASRLTASETRTTFKAVSSNQKKNVLRLIGTLAVIASRLAARLDDGCAAPVRGLSHSRPQVVATTARSSDRYSNLTEGPCGLLVDSLARLALANVMQCENESGIVGAHALEITSKRFRAFRVYSTVFQSLSKSLPRHCLDFCYAATTLLPRGPSSPPRDARNLTQLGACTRHALVPLSPSVSPSKFHVHDIIRTKKKHDNKLWATRNINPYAFAGR
ncbi:hypothetical protein COCCADRAFT_31771 [Bipolaris zeicola 26-R-13]|uniref:Uncharacterized protein n=1 Tax=Cochliobolus carbonum (strain 26-R-13) TaxID=930089 RepID=W6YP15_COCC2|nr:uncharacterized protein COCCADRAFT_31771 [Bipolaris zeicola 26-R-13]EUC39405.1 hypothetical protein COCCADRAFT_31771 [Bipolaris zeicola 26-R-13]